MKIARVINSLDFGGIERVYEIVAKYFEGPRSDLIFIALSSGGRAENYIRSLGYEVIVMNESSRIPNVKLVFRLAKLLKKLKADVVHSCGAEGNFHGQLAAFVARVPVRVAEEIGMPSQSTLAKIIFSGVYRLSTSVIAVASAVAAYLVKENNVADRNVHVVYNPVDVTRFFNIKRPTDEDAFIFLTVCRLHPIKNLNRLLRAFAALDQQKTMLWVVGEGEERVALQQLARDLGIQGQVTFFGYDPDPSSYFERASAFILPSLSEGHPVSMIEAMIAKLPVVVTKVGGARELIEEGINGFLIDPLDVSYISSTMAKVAAMPMVEREKIGRRGCDLVSAKFLPSEYLASLNNLYTRK